jgi:hypothetical protein
MMSAREAPRERDRRIATAALLLAMAVAAVLVYPNGVLAIAAVVATWTPGFWMGILAGAALAVAFEVVIRRVARARFVAEQTAVTEDIAGQLDQVAASIRSKARTGSLIVTFTTSSGSLVQAKLVVDGKETASAEAESADDAQGQVLRKYLHPGGI